MISYFRSRALIGLFLWLVSAPLVLGHKEAVHERITLAAANASSGLDTFLRDVYSVQASSSPIRDLRLIGGPGVNWPVQDWLRFGSHHEDDGLRFKNHFYDPIPEPGRGLTDGSETAYITLQPISSLIWASQRGGGGSAITNSYTWQNGRDHEWNALTSSSEIQRETEMALTLRTVGQVVHLLQDLSQPGHTRNDSHFLFPYIETYGIQHVTTLDYNSARALDWFSLGFRQLEDFWDRGLYTGTSAAPLNNDSGETTLGLAEFSNGNFLSEDSVYREVPSPALHHYEFPSESGTDFATVSNALVAAAKSATLRDQSTVKRMFIAKTGDGVAVEHHATLTYVGYRRLKTGGALPQGAISIHDDKVLGDYHSILIPRAVSYSAGALDYFFRGKLKLRVTWDDDQSRYKVEITNASSQRFKGGAFTLYFDDENGNRNPLTLNLATAWNPESALEPGASIEANFQPPTGTVGGYMLVYKGTIGTKDNGSAADPVDDGLAIAAHQFKILRVRIVWDPLSDIDLYLVDANGAIIWFGNMTSTLGELIVDDIGNTGPENITVKNVIDGDYQVWANYYFDHLNQNPGIDPDTPITVTMKTYFNSATELDTQTFTLTTGDGGEDRPFGVTGPATQPSWYIRKLLKVKDGKLIEH